MSIELLATPSAAIGSDFSPSRNRVWLVEYTGRIARVDLVRGLSGVVSSGTGTLRGTWHFSLDVGGEVGNPGEMPTTSDLWWEQMTGTERQLVPENGAAIAWLGPVSFSSVSHADLQGLTYSTDPIDGSVGSNRLTPGTVLAVRTRTGNYAKVRVVSYGYNLGLEWRTYRLTDRYAVVGTGYAELEDIALSSDGVHAYVTERGGSLLRVDLGDANRSSAVVVSSGMTAPHQIVLDEPRGVAYVVEFAASGQLLRIDLATGIRTVLFSGLQNAIGLAMSTDAKTAWVTEQAASGGRLVALDLVAGRRSEVVGGLVAPFFLEWTDPGRSALYVVERDPNNRVLIVALNTASPSAQVVLTGLPARPSSMVDIGGGRAVVCCDAAIVLEDLGPGWSVTDPFFLGIGHVPATKISPTGYATTDPGYFFQVSEAPFGGTLALQINHDRAFAQGARFYKIVVDGVTQEVPFSDYEWVGMLGTFVLRRTDPDASGYFPVRNSASLWYNHWLGYQLDTSGLSNGLHQIEVRFYTSASTSALVAQQSVHVQIDNTLPLVTIDAIEHQKADGTWETVGRCAIVDKPNNAFRLRITARDPERHLLSWSVGVTWGDNESASIASATYVPGTTSWEGPVGELVPSGGVWVATEKRCAHSFRLSAWDRVINGWGYIHHQSYSKSITLFLP